MSKKGEWTKAILLSPTGIEFKTGRIRGNVCFVGKRAYPVKRKFPRKVGLRRKKEIPYVVCMEGEAATLDYMDRFDADHFENFLRQQLERLAHPDTNGGTVDVGGALEEIYAYRGPDNQVGGHNPLPFLERRFRATPYTDEQLFQLMTDQDEVKLMRNKPGLDPMVIYLILAFILGIVGIIIAFVLGQNQAAAGGDGGGDFEILQSAASLMKARLLGWWHG